MEDFKTAAKKTVTQCSKNFTRNFNLLREGLENPDTNQQNIVALRTSFDDSVKPLKDAIAAFQLFVTENPEELIPEDSEGVAYCNDKIRYVEDTITKAGELYKEKLTSLSKALSDADMDGRKSQKSGISKSKNVAESSSLSQKDPEVVALELENDLRNKEIEFEDALDEIETEAALKEAEAALKKKKLDAETEAKKAEAEAKKKQAELEAQKIIKDQEKRDLDAALKAQQDKLAFERQKRKLQREKEKARLNAISELNKLEVTSSSGMSQKSGISTRSATRLRDWINSRGDQVPPVSKNEKVLLNNMS